MSLAFEVHRAIIDFVHHIHLFISNNFLLTNCHLYGTKNTHTGIDTQSQPPTHMQTIHTHDRSKMKSSAKYGHKMKDLRNKRNRVEYWM